MRALILAAGRGRRMGGLTNKIPKCYVKLFNKNLQGIMYLGGEIKTIESMINDICEIFIPGQKPIYSSGNPTKDQIIEVSNFYKITPFRQAIEELL